MPNRYQITITEIGEETCTIGKTWERGAGADAAEYGYTPETQATRQYKRDVYQQTVAELDIAALVKIVNSGTPQK